MDTSYGLRLNRNAFLQSAALLLALLVVAGGLTLFLPAGSFDRVDQGGTTVVVPGSYHLLTGQAPLPVWRWFTAPFEVLASGDAALTVVILAFILLVGGAFALLDASGIFHDLLNAALRRWSRRPDAVIVGLATAFMLLGSIFGIFEEVVALIPLVVLVAIRLGWDRRMGLGLILLPVGFGFSAALFNPFTIGVAQKLAGVPLWSGLEYRALVFVVTWAILVAFLLRHRRRLEAAPSWVLPEAPPETTVDRRGRGALVTAGLLLVAALVILPLVNLADLSMPIIALGFTVTGFVVALRRGRTIGFAARVFGQGVAGVAPGILLILLAMGIKHLITEGRILDTLLARTAEALQSQGPLGSAAAMYGAVFVLQAFIPSATAKAVLVMPLLTPLGDLTGLTRQTVVLAFNFGDGFSHLLYPTNPLLLIALALGEVSLGRWLRWTIGLQALLFVVTLAFLLAAAAFRYGPV